VGSKGEWGLRESGPGRGVGLPVGGLQLPALAVLDAGRAHPHARRWGWPRGGATLESSCPPRHVFRMQELARVLWTHNIPCRELSYRVPPPLHLPPLFISLISDFGRLHYLVKG